MNEALTMFLGMLGGTIVLISGIYIADRRMKNPFKAPLTDWPVQPDRPWPRMDELEAACLNTFRPSSPTNLALRKYRELMKRCV